MASNVTAKKNPHVLHPIGTPTNIYKSWNISKCKELYNNSTLITLYPQGYNKTRHDGLHKTSCRSKWRFYLIIIVKFCNKIMGRTKKVYTWGRRQRWKGTQRVTVNFSETPLFSYNLTFNFKVKIARRENVKLFNAVEFSQIRVNTVRKTFRCYCFLVRYVLVTKADFLFLEETTTTFTYSDRTNYNFQNFQWC